MTRWAITFCHIFFYCFTNKIRACFMITSFYIIHDTFEFNIIFMFSTKIIYIMKMNFFVATAIKDFIKFTFCYFFKRFILVNFIFLSYFFYLYLLLFIIIC